MKVEEGDAAALEEPWDGAGEYYAGTGTSPIRKHHPLGPYSRPLPRVLWWSWGGGGFL